MDDASAKVPEGTAWCSHCNGYGSSLKDAGDQSAFTHVTAKEPCALSNP